MRDTLMHFSDIPKSGMILKAAGESPRHSFSGKSFQREGRDRITETLRSAPLLTGWSLHQSSDSSNNKETLLINHTGE